MTALQKSDAQTGQWHKFATIREANGAMGIQIAAGVNVYGDGPERTVGRIVGFSAQDANLALAAPELLALVWQYRSDLQFPVAPDSKERRIAAIDAVLKKVEAA